MLRVNCYNQQHHHPIDEDIIREVALLFCLNQCPDAAELDVTFVDKETSSRLHDSHFDDPEPTDCMTFPVDHPQDPQAVLGEIVICPEVAASQASEYKTHYKKELLRYLIHGLLHIMGYDDQTDEQRGYMRTQEDLFLQMLTTNEKVSAWLGER
jgi:probable rRNA maturation factor